MSSGRREMSVLAAGHLAADACLGAVVALLPFLVAERGLSYAQASALVLASTFASSIVQPVLGILSDRRSRPGTMPIALLLAGTGIAAVGLLESYPGMLVAVTLSGLGVAAYHPEATRYVNYVAGESHATAMSVFSVGGNIGLVVGPVLVGVLVAPLGLHGTLGLVVVPAVTAALLARRVGSLRAAGRVARTAGAVAGMNRWGGFTKLAVAVTLRSVAYFGLITFAPLYLVRELDVGPVAANWALTVTLAVGVLATLAGGRLADRVGARRVFIFSMAAVPPLVAAFLTASSPVAATALLALAGAATIATFSTTVVLGQELLPHRIGVAAGVMLGMSIGLGGAGASLLGMFADSIGIRSSLAIVALLPAVVLVVAVTLPREVGRARV